MEARIDTVKSQINADMPVEIAQDFGLEIAELEMLLALKAEENLDFSNALPSALGSSGNDYLFDFPADRFPIAARNVAAIRLHSGDECKVCYAFETKDGDEFRVANDGEIDAVYIDFAQSYAEIVSALDGAVTDNEASGLH